VTALIISVGGSPEPIVKSVTEHAPDFVCFYSSEQTAEIIGLKIPSDRMKRAVLLR